MNYIDRLKAKKFQLTMFISTDKLFYHHENDQQRQNPFIYYPYLNNPYRLESKSIRSFKRLHCRKDR